MHSVKFDVSKFRGVNWEARARWLMTGSLLCLSSDNFETMLFAEVTTRDPLLLREGLLDITFDKLDDDLLNYHPSDTFVMLETNAYFEAYRHNLRKLQSLTEETMPFQDYIIFASREIKPPAYLTATDDVTYDLRPLMIPIPKRKILTENDNVESDDDNDNGERYTCNDNGEYYDDCSDSDDDEDGYYEYEFPEEMDNRKEVPVLQAESWPPLKDLGLDDNQYKAIKNALTREFVIIQGPPGTGKTFIGIRLMQIFIQNRHVWRNQSPVPILIVCYTNHALDQFLEAILPLTTKLVRVGGRCFSEELENYKLASLRRERRLQRRQNGGQSTLWITVNELKMIQAKIQDLEKSIVMASQEVIPEKYLQPHMEHHLWRSLKTGATLAQRVDAVEDDERLILDWLGLRLRGKHAPDWLHGQKEFQEIAETEDKIPEATSETKEISEQKKESEKVYAADDEEDFFLSRHVDEEDKDLMEVLVEQYGPNDNEENLSDDDMGWELLGSSEKRRKYIERQLKNEETLSSKEIEALPANIWSLSLEERWCLYRTWVARFALGQMEEIHKSMKLYQQELETLKASRREEDLNIMRNACVVGMTTTGAAKYQDMVHALGPKIVIVEEAAEVIEAHVVTALCKETEHLILIGDHQQLRPNPAVYELALKYKLDISLFERMVKNNVPCEQLIKQHRMRQSICRLLVPHIYKNLISDASVKAYESVKGVGKNVYFISHDFYEGSEPDSTSLVNKHEAQFLTALCRYLILQGYKPSEITILSTYSMQANLLKRLVNEDPLMREKVHIVAVDSYQGNENEIVLISFVRSNDSGKIGFLSVANRVCVALSRAKKGLYCIGNFQQLARSSELWSQIVEYLSKYDFIGPDLRLFCQNHPTDFTDVHCAEDFKKVPEGGCIRQCTFKYSDSCKHQCKRRCHPFDPEHNDLLCVRKCKKVCPAGHVCNKYCGECRLEESCGKCLEKVVKELRCHHQVKILCGENPEKHPCPMPCGRSLSCSHRCIKTCGEPCNFMCNQIVSVPALCGHCVKIKCHMKTDAIKLGENCKEKCGKVLSCGHECEGTCGTCFQGKFHMICKKPCERKLVCGHNCQERCAFSCPPCPLPCNNRCDHDECKISCSYTCKKCEKPCVSECMHQKCEHPCWKICSNVPCNEPCPKLLKCRHPCTGFCGELCPQLCRQCNVQTIPKADGEVLMFVQLEQCNHAVEEKKLMALLQESLKGSFIQFPCCPACKIPIKSNRRFSNVLRSYNCQLQQIKEQVFRMSQEVKKRKDEALAISEKMILEVEHCVQIHVEKVQILARKKQGVNKTTMLKNILVLLEIVNTCCVDFDSMSELMSSTEIAGISLSKMAVNIRSGVLSFIGKMLEETHSSNQQLSDVCQEVLRLQLLCALVKELSHKGGWKTRDTKLDIRIQDALQILKRVQTLADSSVKYPINAVIAELQQSRGLSDDTSNLRDKIFNSVFYPVNLAIGHWFYCQNGHVFGDSLRAFGLKSKCLECSEPENVDGL